MVSPCFSQSPTCTSSGVPELQYFQDYSTTSDEFTIKLYFNIITDDNFNGGYEKENIPSIIQAIETGFTGTKINFEYVCNVPVINSSALVDIGTGIVNEDEDFCLYGNYTHSDGIDIFINKNGAGSALGRANSIPGNYLVIRDDMSTLNVNELEGTTIVHELAHLFGLMHMHRGYNENPYYWPDGWCSESSNNVVVDLDQCDFGCNQEFNYVCGVGFVEDIDKCAEHRATPPSANNSIGGNGHIAGDLIPDTPPSHPDMERSKPVCQPDNSLIFQNEDFGIGYGIHGWDIVDISGALYNPDYTNYMSILDNKSCRDHFTSDQIAVMKNHIRSHPLLLKYHSTKGALTCDCDYEKIIYLRDDTQWSDVVLDQSIDPNQLADYEIVIEENLNFDMDYTFTNVTFTMTDDADITIKAGKQLTINTGTIGNCENRWGEIYLESSASIDFQDVTMIGGTNAIRTENNPYNSVGKSDISVHRCTINDFTESGITIFTSSEASLHNIDITNVIDYGINLANDVDAEVLIGINIDGADRGIRIINSPFWQQVNDCTFTNCHIGVRYNGTSGSIHDSDFGKNNFGITVHNSAHSFIYRNNIGYNENGVSVSQSSNTNINRNNIGLPQDHGKFGIVLSNVNNSLIEGNPSIYAKSFGIKGDLLNSVNVVPWRDEDNPDPNTNILSSNNLYVNGVQNTNSGGMLFTASTNCNILDNYVFAEEVAVGIEMNNSPSNDIRNNYISISSDLFRSAAIRNMGSVDVEVKENETYSSQSANGIIVQNSAAGIYECNFIYDAYDALNIEHNSTGQYLRGNHKINATNLDFLTRSRLGNQINLGNEYWEGSVLASFNPVTAENDLFNSKFLVDNGDQYHLPTDPNPSEEWFIPNNQTDEQCSGNIGPGGSGTFFSNPVKLCEYWDDIKPLKTSDPELFLIKVMHIIRYFDANPLMAIPDCIKLDPIFINLCGIHEIMDLIDRVTKIGELDPSRSGLATVIDNMSSLYYEYDELTNPVSKENKYNEIKNLYVNSKPVFEQEADYDHIEIQNIKTELNNIDCSDYIIKIIKGAWTIYLDELDQDVLNVTPRLESNINTYSSLCSDEYGDAVHLARSIAVNQKINTYYDSNDGCRDIGYSAPRHDNDDIPNELSLNIYPNPSLGNVNLAFTNKASGTLQIFNSKGDIILKTYVKDKLTQLLEIENNGIYFAKFTSDQGDILSGKIIVIR